MAVIQSVNIGFLSDPLEPAARPIIVGNNVRMSCIDSIYDWNMHPIINLIDYKQKRLRLTNSEAYLCIAAELLPGNSYVQRVMIRPITTICW
jgi:hypothetical protein